MIFFFTNKHFPIELSKIFINNTQIELVQHTGFLRVIIGLNLTMSTSSLRGQLKCWAC